MERPETDPGADGDLRMGRSGPIVVLGAGCAGLAAAWRLRSKGREVLILESQDRVGGLAGGVRLHGNVYEYGPHVFHTTDPEILADVKNLMGADLLPFRRTIQIKFLGNYFQFPLSVPDVLFKLPPWTVARAAASFLFRLLEGLVRRPAVETSETLLRRYYGDVLYGIFFKDYILRVWGIPASEFSPAFARERIPRLNILEFLEKLASSLRLKLGGAVTTRDYVEKVAGDLYTTRQGFSLITQRMADRLVEAGARLELNVEVVGLERDGDRISGVMASRKGVRERIDCAAVISTLPINEVSLSISPPLGEEVRKAAASLRFRSTVFVGVKVRRPKVLPASFMYFREHSFNRITDLAHFSHQIEPAGCTLLIAEINCDPGDRVWEDEGLAKESVRADMERERLLRSDEILEMHVFRSRHAYPIYSLHYERSLAALLEGLGSLKNFDTAGRQGRFQYVNTHIAMKMGYEAADRLMKLI